MNFQLLETSVEKMIRLTQGIKLMLLVKEREETDEQIAKAMGYGRTYLPKLYKMEILPPAAIQSAVDFFGVPETYFTDEAPSMVEEPATPYLNAPDEVARLKAENALLRQELEAMRQRLVDKDLEKGGEVGNG